MGLLPDVRTYFEVTLLDALPANARDAALQHSSLDDMAEAADLVLLENRAAAASLRDPVVANVSAADPVSEYYAELQPHVAAVSSAPSGVSSRGPKKPPFRRTDTLCAIHAKWGRDAYRCGGPSFCRMKSVVRPAPQPSSVPGNAAAGGRQ